MKFNTKFFYVALASLAMTGCGDDWNEDKLDGFGEKPVTDVKTLEITLSDADYKTIASNSTNKSIAEAAGVSSQLSKLTDNKYFTDEIPASTYVPAFLAATYYTADNGSSIKVTSNVLVGEPEYLSSFNKAQYVSLAEEDYEQVWGEKVQAYFLTPKTESQVARTLLPAAIPNAEAGDMVMVEYAYSDVEPSIGGGSGTTGPTWMQLETPVRAFADFNFVNMGVFDLTAFAGQNVRIGFKYKSSTSAAATWELMNFRASSLPYQNVSIFAKQEDGSFAKIVTSSTFAGAGEYVIAALGAEGKFYPFGRLDKDTDTYGYMNPESIEVIDNVISAENAAKYILTLEAVEGGYTIKNAIGKYLYMKGSYSSFNVADAVNTDEGNGFVWSVSNTGSKYADQFYLTNVLKDKTVRLSYNKGVFSYGSYDASTIEGKTYTYSSLINEDGGFIVDDVELGDLTSVWSTSKYGWKASARVDNVNYATESFLVSPAFTIAEDAVFPCFTIDETYKYTETIDKDLTVWIAVDYPETVAVSTRSVKGNKTALYEFDGANWNKATVDEGKLAVMQPDDYVSLGAKYISNPENVLPIYAANNYPYAVEDDALVVAYLSGNTQVSAKELIFDGLQWNLTTKVATQVDQFVMADGKWNWDPSVTINLPATKGDALSVTFFQAATDWVWENVDVPAGCTAKGQGYVTSYANNEYYCGCSAYQCDVDWRPAKAKEQNPKGYEGLSDDEILELMKERFIEVMGHVLEGQYPSAQLVPGVKVTYTINFVAYTGSNVNWTIQYELTGTGKFTYIEDSLAEVK